MRRPLIILLATMSLASCSQAVEKAKSQASGPAPGSQEHRALRQLEARLGAGVAVSELTTGTDEGKPLLCGTASILGGQARPFVLRNGFLLLAEDAPPEAFERLRNACTRPAA